MFWVMLVFAKIDARQHDEMGYLGIGQSLQALRNFALDANFSTKTSWGEMGWAPAGGYFIGGECGQGRARRVLLVGWEDQHMVAGSYLKNVFFSVVSLRKRL